MKQKHIIAILLLLLVGSVVYNILQIKERNELIAGNRILKLQSEIQRTLAEEQKREAEEHRVKTKSAMQLMADANHLLEQTLLELETHKKK